MNVVFVPSWFPTDTDPSGGIFFQRLYEALGSVHQMRLINPPRGTSLPSFVASVVRAVRRSHTDVIHAHVASPAGAAALAARRVSGVPVVLTEHSGPLTRLYGASRTRKAALRRVFSSVDELAAPSERMRDDLVALGVTREIAVVPNLVDVGDRQPSRTPGLFVTVASMTDRTKGLDYLLPAWRDVATDAPDARLRVIGSGPLLNEYRELAATLGLRDLVEFAGSLRPITTLDEIARADVYVQASVHESFGVALVEAAALGKPIIATSVGVAAEFIDASIGVLVPPASLEPLHVAVLDVFRRREQYDRGAIARRATARFGPTRVVKLTTDLYERACEHRGAA